VGHDVHITRKRHWADDAPRIARDDWLAVVDVDPELELDAALTSTVRGEEDAPVAVWTRHPEHFVPFLHLDGDVVVTQPDAATLHKMWQVAVHLGARVQGIDGVFYDEAIRAEAPQPRPWWKLW
jgi:hypothetical protein